MAAIQSAPNGAQHVDDARRLIADGTISGGMIPKVETCIYALEAGVEGVVILDGKVPHAVLLEGDVATGGFAALRDVGFVCFRACLVFVGMRWPLG